MNGNVSVAQATSDEAVLPERVQEALGQLVGVAKEGLLALSVGVGLGVTPEQLAELIPGTRDLEHLANGLTWREIKRGARAALS